MNINHPLLSLSIVLFAGIVGGEMMARAKLPKVTGWIGTGIVLRAVGVPGLPVERLPDFSALMSFVLGFIAFTVGAALNFRSLHNAHKRLLLLIVGEAVVTPAVVGTALHFVGGLSVDVALLLSAIAIAGAPGTTVLVVQEARARGNLSKTLVAAVGLIDMVAVGAFVVAAVFATEASMGSPWQIATREVAHQFGFALLVGLGVAALVLGWTRTIVSPAFLGPSMVAAWARGDRPRRWGFHRSWPVHSRVFSSPISATRRPTQQKPISSRLAAFSLPPSIRWRACV